MTRACAHTRAWLWPRLPLSSFSFSHHACSFLWMWPNARISVMGGEQAANVMYTIQETQRESTGRPAVGSRVSPPPAAPEACPSSPTFSSICHQMTEEETRKLKDPIEQKYESEGHPYFASARYVACGARHSPPPPPLSRVLTTFFLSPLPPPQLVGRRRD